ncbi:MAG: hypothetical protein DI582_04440 [Azospirillum brasilense]|nr:MAG: hypothetical protein DI582_04440 [Azospirillum brasilense]
MELILLLVIGWAGWKFFKGKPERHAHQLSRDAFQMMAEKRAKIEAQGIPYVHHNPEEGVFQMVNFPYTSYAQWDAAYRAAAIQANQILAPKLTKDGTMLSLLDLMDEEPCRRAYNHHLDPQKLGQKFGENFDPLQVGFPDGTTASDLVGGLKAQNS